MRAAFFAFTLNVKQKDEYEQQLVMCFRDETLACGHRAPRRTKTRALHSRHRVTSTITAMRCPFCSATVPALSVRGA